MSATSLVLLQGHINITGENINFSCLWHVSILLDKKMFSNAYSFVYAGPEICWPKHLATPKLPNYRHMQNAWSMDFIPWLPTHVSQLEFILLASLPEEWRGWVRGHNEEGGVPYLQWNLKLSKCRETGLPVETSVTEGRLFFDNAEGDRHWLCAVWHGITGEGKGHVQMAWNWIKWRLITQTFCDKWYSLHVFFIISC